MNNTQIYIPPPRPFRPGRAILRMGFFGVSAFFGFLGAVALIASFTLSANPVPGLVFCGIAWLAYKACSL